MSEPEFSEAEYALLDISRALFDIVILAGSVKREDADALLSLHQERWVRQSRPKAAAMIALLRSLSTGPVAHARLQAAEDQALLRKAKPEGTA